MRRHHELAVRTYDGAALDDLSHVLRTWSEIPAGLSDQFEEVRKRAVFTTASPPKKAIRLTKGYDYVLTYLPGGAVTHAHGGRVFSCPAEEGQSYNVGGGVRIDGDALELHGFFYIGASLDKESGPYLSSKRHRPKTKRCNFANWMGAEAVRFRYRTGSNDEAKMSLGRGVLLKRVANYFEGSHSALSRKDDEHSNVVDEHLDWLMKFTLGGLPLPYFLLVKTAQDILKVMPRLVGVEYRETAGRT